MSERRERLGYAAYFADVGERNDLWKYLAEEHPEERTRWLKVADAVAAAVDAEYAPLLEALEVWFRAINAPRSAHSGRDLVTAEDQLEMAYTALVVARKEKP